MSANFFPNIFRADKYDMKDDLTYHAYSYYHDQVGIDCQHRCVYCDVMLEEIGHEGFHLDHFRPQDKFPELRDTPQNLVIACSKCNRWKFYHWPIDINLAVSHDGISGFIEPFESQRCDYFHVEPDGKVTPLQGPATYMINLLHLNRPSRMLVRRIRMVSCKIDELLNTAQNTINKAVELLQQGQSTSDAIRILSSASQTIKDIKEIRDTIATAKV